MINVQMDDREPKKILEIVKDVGGMKMNRKRMLVGDYVCGDVCIERKTVEDLCGSICDGRVKRQVANMKKNFKHCYVLVSGKLGDRRSTIHENCVLGLFARLLVKDGVPVICVDNDRQLVYLMKRIFERHDGHKVKEGFLSPLTSDTGGCDAPRGAYTHNGIAEDKDGKQK